MAQEERTLGQLVAQASDDLSGIVRAEIALAKAELRVDAKNAAAGGGMFGAAGYLVLLATVLLCIAAAYGLVAAGLAPWLAFLIVAVVLVLLAALLSLIGRARLRKLQPPPRALPGGEDTIAAGEPRHPPQGRG